MYIQTNLFVLYFSVNMSAMINTPTRNNFEFIYNGLKAHPSRFFSWGKYSNMYDDSNLLKSLDGKKFSQNQI
jgi:hypothetical protein